MHEQQCTQILNLLSPEFVDDCPIGVVLVSLYLNLNIFHTCFSVSIVNFKYVISGWECHWMILKTFALVCSVKNLKKTWKMIYTHSLDVGCFSYFTPPPPNLRSHCNFFSFTFSPPFPILLFCKPWHPLEAAAILKCWRDEIRNFSLSSWFENSFLETLEQ